MNPKTGSPRQANGEGRKTNNAGRRLIPDAAGVKSSDAVLDFLRELSTCSLLRQFNSASGDSAEHRAIRAELRRRELEKAPLDKLGQEPLLEFMRAPSLATFQRAFPTLSSGEKPGTAGRTSQSNQNKISKTVHYEKINRT